MHIEPRKAVNLGVMSKNRRLKITSGIEASEFATNMVLHPRVRMTDPSEDPGIRIIMQ
jgi:hypothetical protein